MSLLLVGLLVLLALADPAHAVDFTVTGLTQGQTVSGQIRVSATPSADTILTNFVFSLLSATGTVLQSNQEGATPYCFVGDTGAPPCTPFVTTARPDGAYTLRIAMNHAGGTLTKLIGFTIANTGPPPPSTQVTATFNEPRTNVDGTPLSDLAKLRIYCRVGADLEQICAEPPASAPTGSDQPRTHTFSVAAITGLLSVAMTAIDTTGNESARSNIATKELGAGLPGQAGVVVQVVNE